MLLAVLLLLMLKESCIDDEEKTTGSTFPVVISNHLKMIEEGLEKAFLV